MPNPTNLPTAATTELDTPASENPARTPAGPHRERPAPREINGPAGPEPTRYGDWERQGRCIDF